MPCLGVRDCSGTVLSALHFLIRWTPSDEPLQASATEACPIPESIQGIVSFEHSGIRAATLSTGIHKEFRQFASPFLFGVPRLDTPRSRDHMGMAVQTERHSARPGQPDAGARPQAMKDGLRTGERDRRTPGKCPAFQESVGNRRRADGARIPRHPRGN